MYRVRSVMSRSSRIMCAWNAAIMTENLWPRRLNENHRELLQEACPLFAAALLFLPISPCFFF